MFGRAEPFEASNSRNGIFVEQQRNWRRNRANVLREDGAGPERAVFSYSTIRSTGCVVLFGFRVLG